MGTLHVLEATELSGSEFDFNISKSEVNARVLQPSLCPRGHMLDRQQGQNLGPPGQFQGSRSLAGRSQVLAMEEADGGARMEQCVSKTQSSAPLSG